MAGARRAAERLAELERRLAETAGREAGEEAEALAGSADDIGGFKVVAARSQLADKQALMNLADRVRGKLGEAAVVLGGGGDGKVTLVAMLSEGAVARGLSAADVMREAAAVVGGGGGGRPNVAQAGGRDASRLDEALATARAAIERGLGAGEG